MEKERDNLHFILGYQHIVYGEGRLNLHKVKAAEGHQRPTGENVVMEQTSGPFN